MDQFIFTGGRDVAQFIFDNLLYSEWSEDAVGFTMMYKKKKFCVHFFW